MATLLTSILKNRYFLMIGGFFLLALMLYIYAYNTGYNNAVKEQQLQISKLMIERDAINNEKIKQINDMYLNVNTANDKLHNKIRKLTKKGKINAMRLADTFRMCTQRYTELARQFDEY